MSPIIRKVTRTHYRFSCFITHVLYHSRDIYTSIFLLVPILFFIGRSTIIMIFFSFGEFYINLIFFFFYTHISNKISIHGLQKKKKLFFPFSPFNLVYSPRPLGNLRICLHTSASCPHGTLIYY